MRNLPSLDKILSADVVLIDTSIKGGDDYSGYSISTHLRDCGNYDQLDETHLEIVMQDIADYYGLLSKENVFVCKGSPNETAELREIISQAIKYYNGKLKNKRNQHFRSEKSKKSELYLSQLQKNIWATEKLAKMKVLYLENPRYEGFLKIVEYLDKLIGLERITPLIGNEAIKSGNVSPVDTEAIALSYCLSLDGKRVNIMTRDGDQPRLLSACSKIMCCDEFFPENREFRESIKQTPIEIYWKDGDINHPEYKFTLGTGELKFDKRLRICSLPDEEVEVAKERIRYFFEKYFSLEEIVN